MTAGGRVIPGRSRCLQASRIAHALQYRDPDGANRISQVHSTVNARYMGDFSAARFAIKVYPIRVPHYGPNNSCARPEVDTC